MAAPTIANARVEDNAAVVTHTLANNWVQSAGNMWIIEMNWDNGATLNSGNGPTCPGLTFYPIVINHTFSGAILEVWFCPKMPPGASGAFTITAAMSASCAHEIYIMDIAPPAG